MADATTRRVLTEDAFVAVRRPTAGGEDEADLATVSYHRRGAEMRAKEGRTAAWQRANPVVRIAKVRIEEETR